MTLFQKACDGGNTEGCKDLSRCYQEGLGVKADQARAKALQQKARDWAGKDR